MKNQETATTPTDAGTKRPLSRFARRLSVEWRRLALPVRGERIVVAVSGGADSTALLLAFDELNRAGRMALTLKVAHLDHGLRGEAGASDARWVETLTRELGYEFASERAEGVASSKMRAHEGRDNLEQAARRARYDFLGRVARAWEARAVLAGHTLDDQAETMLLALLRGSGARGLGGMRERRGFAEAADRLLLVRPLLNWARRAETLEYCAARGVVVRADEMNEDERFARVRVRRQLLPLLETFNPRAVETLARTAGLLRAEADVLENLGGELLLEACREARAGAGTTRTHSTAGVRRTAFEKDAAADSPAPGEGSLSLGEGSLSLGEESLLPGESSLSRDEGSLSCGESSLSHDEDSVSRGESSLSRVEDSVLQGEDSLSLSVEVLRGADEAVRRYALRVWIAARRGNLRRIESVHIEAVGKLLEGGRGGRVAELPGGCRVERRRGLLLFHAAKLRTDEG